MANAPGLILLIAGVLLLEFGPGVLATQTWLSRMPRRAVLLWQSLLLGSFSGVLLGAAALALPNAWVSHSLGTVFHVCDRSLTSAYRVDGSGIAALGGIFGSVAVAALLTRGATRSWRGVRTARRNVRDLLMLVGRPAPHLSPRAIIVESPFAGGYCLPGRRPLGRARGCIVVSTASVERLDDAQLRAVLAHEHAHLDERHHLVLLIADAFAETFPFLRGPRTARDQIARLLEMVADKAAAGSGDRRSMAAALLALSCSTPLAGAMAAATLDAPARVRRLLAPPRPPTLSPGSQPVSPPRYYWGCL